MATHSSVLAWRIPETAEPSGLPSMGLHRVEHDWSNLAAAAAAAEDSSWLTGATMENRPTKLWVQGWRRHLPSSPAGRGLVLRLRGPSSTMGTSSGGRGSPSSPHGSDDAAPKPAATHSRGPRHWLQLLGCPNGTDIKVCVLRRGPGPRQLHTERYLFLYKVASRLRYSFKDGKGVPTFSLPTLQRA